MKVDKYKIREEFRSEDGDYLSVTYDNRGDPFSEGVTLMLKSFKDEQSYVYLERQKALRLAKLINDLYG